PGWRGRRAGRSVCGVSALSVVRRPVRAVTWRELAYLLLGFAMSIVTFVVLVTLVSLGVSLLITFVGLPILLATAYVNRWFADVERRRAALVLGEPVARHYRDVENPGFWQRVRVVATDPQTWKDYGWLILLTIVGFGFGLAAIVLWSVALGMLSVPLWWWIPPHDTVLTFDDSSPSSWSVDSWPRALLVGGAGL